MADRRPLRKVLNDARFAQTSGFIDGPVWADANVADASRIPTRVYTVAEATAWMHGRAGADPDDGDTEPDTDAPTPPGSGDSDDGRPY